MRLRAFGMPKTAAAVDKLMRFAGTSAPLRLFRELYPEEFAAFERRPVAPKGSTWLADRSVADIGAYLFAKLLCRDHFPVSDLCMVLDASSGIRLGDYWGVNVWEDDLDAYRSGVRLAALLAYGSEIDEGNPAIADDDDDEAPRAGYYWASLGWAQAPPEPIAESCDFALFERLCAAETSPMRHLFLAALVVV